MAGTARQATVSTNPFLATLAPLAGVGGIGISWNQWTNNAGFPDPQLIPSFTGTALVGRVSDQEGTPGMKTTVARQATTSPFEATFQSWFEHVHVLPRAEIEFGNIITQEQQEYELFNAYRNTTVTLTGITNNISPGITPNISTPDAQGALSSWFDPTTTANDGGTGLGTIVKWTLDAEPEGLPTFSGTVEFAFDVAATVSLLASGRRLVLIPFEYESPMRERLLFATDVMESVNGKEQRAAFRKQPRQQFDVRYQLDGTERQRMQVLLMDWMANFFGFPLWHEAVYLTATVSSGATVYQVTGADEVDFRVGGLAVVLTDNRTFDIINISAVTATTITAADVSLNGYAVGTPVMPVRIARISRTVDGRRALNELETFGIEFESTDNDTGALTGSTAGFSSYNGRVLLDDCNVVVREMRQQYLRRIFVTDNQSGIVTQASPWDRFKRVHQKGFVARSRAAILALRRLLIALDGRRTAFYIPTFFDDVTVSATLSVGGDTIDIDNIEYVRFAQSRDPKTIMKITFTDGTSLVRVVQSAATVSSTVERLTLDSTWPATRTVDEVQRVQFYELVRFDTDRLEIEYPRIGLAGLQAPVRAVFDDIT